MFPYLKKRCTELNLQPCSGAGVTVDVLLAKINAEERTRGLSLTVVEKKVSQATKITKSKTTHGPEIEKKRGSNKVSNNPVIASSTTTIPKTISQYEAEIKESNPDLYTIAKRRFFKGDLPPFLHTASSDAVKRWKHATDAEKVGERMIDPWHRLHNELFVLGLEGNESDLKSIERLNGVDGMSINDLARWGRDRIRELLAKYGTMIWLLWRANSRSPRWKQLFVMGGRLDFIEPIKAITGSLINALSDLKTAEELHRIDPGAHAKAGDDTIGLTYWKIASGDLTKPIDRSELNAPLIHSVRANDLAIDLIEYGYLKPNADLLIASVGSPKLFGYLMAKNGIVLTIDDLPALLKITIPLSTHDERIPAELRDAELLIQHFGLAKSPEAQQYLSKLISSLLFMAFLREESFRAKVDRKILFEAMRDVRWTIVAYNLYRMVKEHYDDLFTEKQWRKLSPVVFMSYLSDEQVEAVLKIHPLYYQELSHLVSEKTYQGFQQYGGCRLPRSFVERLAKVELIGPYDNFLMMEAEQGNQVELGNLLIERDIYGYDESSIHQLLNTVHPDWALYLLERPKVIEILGRAGVEKEKLLVEQRPKD